MEWDSFGELNGYDLNQSVCAQRNNSIDTDMSYKADNIRLSFLAYSLPLVIAKPVKIFEGTCDGFII